MEELRKNRTYTAVVTGYTSEGCGVCRIRGKAVFVKGALMGEAWEVLIVKVSSSAVYGKGVKCLSASPCRETPSCPVFGKCGGCDLLHMSYEEELRYKLSRVNDALERVGGLDFRIAEIVPADEDARTRYRNKAIYNAAPTADGRAVLGFYRERSHEVAPITDCLIQTEASVKCLAALREFMDLHGLAAYDEKTGRGSVRRLLTRCAKKSAQTVACVVSADGLESCRDALAEHLTKSCPELTGVALCVNPSRGNSVLSDDIITLWGSEMLTDELCGLTFRYSVASFFQINPPQAEKLYERAVSYACPKSAGVVLDLYCGTGTIGLCAAGKADKVFGVEVAESAVENARQNALDNGITNAEFILGDAGIAASSLEKAGLRPEAVIVDPPRKGLNEDVIDAIARMAPERVVYVSCDPATLARDLRRFAALGYEPKKGAAVDMFPSCAHVETVVLLESANKIK